MFYLRNVEQEDMDLLFEWANDPLTRRNSFNSSDIQYDEHVRWFNRIINEDDVKIFILMRDNDPVGQVRINITESNAEISYSIAPKYRGNGFGRRSIFLIVRQICREYPEIKTVSAKVKPDNLASKAIFEKEGFEIKSIEYILETTAQSMIKDTNELKE